MTRTWTNGSGLPLSGPNLNGIEADLAIRPPVWQPATAYQLNQVVVSPNNDVVKALAAHTSGTTFNPSNWSLSGTFVQTAAKGAANGVAGLDGSARVPVAQMPTSYVPKWQPTTVYAAGDQVVSPNNDVVTANTAHTSGASFTAANWTLASVKAGGKMWRQLVTTNSGYVGGLTVMNNIPSFTFKAGRKYRIIWDSDALGDTTNTGCAASIQSASTADAGSAVTGLTMLAIRDAYCFTAAYSFELHVEAIIEPTADTTLQIKFLLQRDTPSGTGTFAVQGSRSPTHYAIYDEGAQF